MILDAEIALDAGLDDDPNRYPIFLRRNSWWNPKSAFLVIDTYPDVREWSILKPPYFNGPAWAKVQVYGINHDARTGGYSCLLYTSPSPRDRTRSRMPSSA